MLFFPQVETVGDKYMTVSGLPEPCTHHAKSICHLALDMLEIAGQVKVDDEPVQVCGKQESSSKTAHDDLLLCIRIFCPRTLGCCVVTCCSNVDQDGWVCTVCWI